MNSKACESPWPAGLTLRRMVLADVDAVHALDTRCFSLPWPRSSFVSELANPNSESWVVETTAQGGSAPVIVAMAVVWTILDEGHIATFAVDEAWRRQGVGKALLCHIIRHARQAGVWQIFLEVRRNNMAAQDLYSRAGFEIIDVRKGYYKDIHEDAFIMRLRLD